MLKTAFLGQEEPAKEAGNGSPAISTTATVRTEERTNEEAEHGHASPNDRKRARQTEGDSSSRNRKRSRHEALHESASPNQRKRSRETEGDAGNSNNKRQRHESDQLCSLFERLTIESHI